MVMDNDSLYSPVMQLYSPIVRVMKSQTKPVDIDIEQNKK